MMSLSTASFPTITVNYATADGTATVADGDYVAASGTVTFLPGVTSQPAAVTVNGDTKFEPNYADRSLRRPHDRIGGLRPPILRSRPPRSRRSSSSVVAARSR